MQDVIWLGVYLVSIGIMAACWLLDRRTAWAVSRGGNRLVLDLAKQVGRLECECHGLKREAARLQTALDDAGPIIVGDPERDPLCLEISLCGPYTAAIYVSVMPTLSLDHVSVFGWSNCSHWDRDRKFLCLYNEPYGKLFVAASADVEEICDAVRRYNESFRNSKGVDDAGTQQEAGAGDCDRAPGPADHGDGHGDPARHRQARCACRPERTSTPPGDLRPDQGGEVKASRKI